MTSISLISKEYRPASSASAFPLERQACEIPASGLATTVATSLDWLRFSGGDGSGALLRRAEFLAGSPNADIHHPSNFSASLGLKAIQPSPFPSWNNSADTSALLGLGLAQYLPSVPGESSPEPMQSCPGTVTVSGTAIFGDVRINTLQTRYFTITNSNSCSVSYTIAGGGYGFSVSSSGGTLPANNSVSFSITFSPYLVQSYSGSISISPGGTGITLSGRGVN